MYVASGPLAAAQHTKKPDVAYGKIPASTRKSIRTQFNPLIDDLPSSGGSIFEVPQLEGTGGLSTVAADVNGDGIIDLLTSGVTVSLGNGDGTFQPPVGYDSGGQSPVSIALADVNGDGKVDILVANNCAYNINNFDCEDGGSGGVIGVLLGNGDGTFQSVTPYSSGGLFAWSVAVGDLNDDGKPDLLVANDNCADEMYCQSGGTLAVLLGNGDGTFQPAITYNAAGYGSTFVAVADLNGDGKLDAVVGNQCTTTDGCGGGANSSSVGVLIGNGDGTFRPAASFDSGGYAIVSLIAADVNGDGKVDLLVADDHAECSTYCPDGMAGVLLGNGDGTFRKSATYDGGGLHGTALAVGDVNGDGRPDLIISDSCDASSNCAQGIIEVLSGNGDGTFTAGKIYETGSYQPKSLVIADLNKDGKSDVTVTHYSGESATMFGNGDGTFRSAPVYASGGGLAQSVAVADVNADGIADIIVSDQCPNNFCSADGSVGVLLGDPDGTFNQVVVYSTGGNSPYSVATADFNGDGHLDLVVANCGTSNCGGTSFGSLGILINNGDGTFRTAVTYSSGGNSAYSVAVGDLNGDGRPDLVVANYCGSGCNGTNGTVGILLGNGDGTFQSALTVPSGGYGANSVAISDVNSDSKQDVIVANQCSTWQNCVSGPPSSGVVSIILGNGDGTFKPAVSYDAGGYHTQTASVADMNADGKPDLIVVNQCADSSRCGNGATGLGTVGILMGNGDGTFQAPIVADLEVPVGFGPISIADFNGDGHLDIASGAGDFLLLGNGDGTFLPLLSLEASGIGIAAGDFNGDHKTDLALGGVIILLNIGPGSSPTTTSLLSSVNPSEAGQVVTLTASVVSTGGLGTPTGTVNFLDSNTSLGMSTLNASGIATISTSTLSVGTHPITASYSGDSTFAPSTSGVVNQIVQGSIGTVAPSNLSFSNQTLGLTSAPQNVMLTNTGNVSMAISGISIIGSNSSDFSETNTCPSSLAPGIACSVSVTFTPRGLGARMASVNITDSAINSPQTVALSGTGIAPVVTLTPPSLNFGLQSVGTTSSPQVVTLSTNGTLNITSIVASAEFGETNNCGDGLPAGGSCQINVTFTPNSSGIQNGNLTFSDSGTGSPQSVPLSGTGTQSAVMLTPASLSFGNQTLNSDSPPQFSTLTNTGNGTLTLSSIAVGGANHGDFSQTNNCPSTILPNSSCKISVIFKPSATGLRSANVIITDNAPTSPQSLPLSGVGVSPAVTFSPTSLTFPDQTIFTTSPAQKLTLTNTGLGILTISGGSLTGQFGETNNCGGTLKPGASCTAEIAFKPKAKGTLRGTISVTDNAPGSPQTVPLTGTGTFVQLKPTTINFGNQPVNTTSLPKYITLTNQGTATVNFTGSGITIAGSDEGDFAETTNCSSSLAVGASCMIKVTFTPSAQGQRTADVSISDDGGGSPQMVPLRGTGTP
jgi:hypothetical protein